MCDEKREQNRLAKPWLRSGLPQGLCSRQRVLARSEESQQRPGRRAPAARGPALPLLIPPAKGENVIRAISISKNIKTWKLWAVS